MAKTTSPLDVVTRLVRDLTRQLAALMGRVEVVEQRLEKLEQRLGAPARPKTEKLSRDEWLARKRAAIQKAAKHRWRKAKDKQPPAAKKRRRRKARAR